MTKKERMYHAIAHEPVDKIPKGEIAISAALAKKVLGTGYSDEFQDFEREKEIHEVLKMDFINVGDWPSVRIGETATGIPVFQSNYGEFYSFDGTTKHVVKMPFESIEESDTYEIPDIKNVSGNLIRRFSEETDLFVFAQIGGPISMVNELLGMEEYMVDSLTYTQEVKRLAEKIVTYEILKAKLFLDSGADAILLADDMAFNSGLLLPPYIMEEIAYPFYEQMLGEIKQYKQVPVILHTDGNINGALERIVSLGFDGVHSLQPSAGMDIREVKEKYGDRLCLMGNIDLNYIMTFATPEEVRCNVEETIRIAAKGSGFVLCTCNCLIDVIPKENALAMYETAEEFDMEQIACLN